MSFDDIATAAGSWVESHQNFSLILPDEDEGCLYMDVVLNKESRQFHISCPSRKKDCWSVRTLDEDFFLQKAKNLCATQSELTVVEILDAIHDKCMELSEQHAEEDEDDYYNNQADDGFLDDFVVAPKRPDVKDDEASRFATSGTPMATSRLLTDMKAFQSSNGKYGLDGAPRGDNLYVWDIKLTDFEPKSQLGKDLKEYARKFKTEPAILLEMTFPDDYPMAPPFVRVLKPRFRFLTGHVTIGGSICMEMLTRSGWSPGNDIESIMIQIRSEIMSDPNASIETHHDRGYTETEARDAFKRMVEKYKWN